MDRDQEVVFRDGEISDVAGILALQSVNFLSRGTLEDWRWKNESPDHKANVNVVASLGETIVGSYSIVALPINVVGTRQVIGQITDNVVDKDFRKQGLGLLLTQRAAESYKKSGLIAIYGYPNDFAAKTTFTRYDNRILTWMKVSSTRVSIRSPLASLPFPVRSLADLAFRSLVNLKARWRRWFVQRHLPRTLRIEKSATIPPSFDDFWNVVAKQEIVSLWKDRQYLVWRYDMNPNNKAEYYFALNGSEIVGFAALVTRDKIAYVSELLVKNWNVFIGKRLVQEMVIDCLGKKDVEVVKVFFHDRGFLEEVFSDFVLQGQEYMLTGTGLFQSEVYELLLREKINWTLITGDTDAVW